MLSRCRNVLLCFATVLLSVSGSTAADAASEGWKPWSPRAEIAPRFSVEATGGRHGGTALVIEGNNNPAAFGAWKKRIGGITGGRNYRFLAYYRLEGVVQKHRHVSARLNWLDVKGKSLRPPDFALDAAKEGEWTRFEHVSPAPEEAQSAEIVLSFGWTDTGRIRWDSIELSAEKPGIHQRVV